MTAGGRAAGIAALGMAGFGVFFVDVVENADWAGVAAVLNRFDDLGVEVALADGQDFLAGFVAILGHAVEVEAEEVGFGFGEQVGEAIEVFVGVVEVVDDADVGGAIALQ